MASTDSGNMPEDWDDLGVHAWTRYGELCHELGNYVEQNNRTSENSGSITIVTVGTKSIGHCTLEVLTEIKRVNYVFLLVDDVITKLFLTDLRPDAFDLDVFTHQTCIHRYEKCVKMAELCLHQARKGSSVCLVCHGDSGEANVTSQRVYQIATSEGMEVSILCSPPLMDSLIASLAIDTSFGLIAMNAVDFLLTYTELDTNNNIILLRLGDLKELSRFGRLDSLSIFRLFVNKLIQTYTCLYEVVHYHAVQYCLVHPPYERVTLAVLSNMTEEQLINIPEDSSLYLPAKPTPTVDVTMGMTLGCLSEGTAAHAIVKRDLGLCQEDYGSDETEALAGLKTWVVPMSFQWPRQHDMTDLMCELSLNANILWHYRKKRLSTKDGEQDSVLWPWSEWKQHMSFEGIPMIKQMIVFYDNDADDERDDISVSSSDSDFMRETYTETPEDHSAHTPTDTKNPEVHSAHIPTDTKTPEVHSAHTPTDTKTPEVHSPRTPTEA